MSTAGDGLAVFGDFDPAGRQAYEHAVKRFRENNIVLPTFAQLRDPSTIPAAIIDRWPRSTRTPPTRATCSGCTGSTNMPTARAQLPGWSMSRITSSCRAS